MFCWSIFLVLLALYATEAARTIYNTCPDEVLHNVGTRYLQVHDGFCFNFAVYKWRTYDDADGDCHNSGGTLALPKTQALNDYLADQLFNYYGKTDEAWIGLHDKNQEGEFEWEDHTEVKWTNFAPGNGPDNSWIRSPYEDCVAIDPLDGGLWHDFQCRQNMLAVVSGSQALKMYICQYPPKDITTVQPTVKVTAASTTAKVTAASTTAKVTAASSTAKVTAASSTAKVTAATTTEKREIRHGGEPKLDIQD